MLSAANPTTRHTGPYRRKLTVAFILTSFVPLLLSFLIVIAMSTYYYRDKALNSLSSAMVQVGHNIDARLIQVSRISNTLTSYLTGELYNEGNQDKSYLALTDFVKMRETVRTLENNYDIYGIRVFSDRLPFIKSDKINFFSMSQLEELPITREQLEEKVSLNYLRAVVTHSGELIHQTTRPTKCLSFYRTVKNIYGEIQAIFIIDVEASSFLLNINDNTDIVAAIVDEDGNVLQSNSPEYDGVSSIEVSQWDIDYHEENNRIYVSHTLNGVNWRLVMSTPKSELYRMAFALIPAYVLLFFLAIILCIFAGVLLSNVLYKRIDGLCYAVNAIDFHEDLEYGSIAYQLDTMVLQNSQGDEIDLLIHSFRNLLQKNTTLLERVTQRDIDIERYKFSILQAQINPHFLYNALDTIRSSMLLGFKEQARESIDALSRFYRISLSKGRDIITIAEELDMLCSYLEIERTGYNGRVSWTICCDPNAKQLSIPKFTLQPIAENSIIHGKRIGVDTTIHLDICVSISCDAVEINVSDNGAGIPTDVLIRLQQQLDLRENPSDAGSYGLHNINNRLRLIYGEAYGLEIENGAAVGVLTTIRCPKHGLD